MKTKDLTGLVFNMLTVVSRHGTKRSGTTTHSTWNCLCKCGKTCVYTNCHLTRKTNPVLSCGCKRGPGRNHKNADYVGDISGDWWASRVTRTRGHRREKLQITITREYAWELFLLQNKQCALSGLPIVIHRHDGTASIDRIDSAQGYVIGNVQWVHKDVNRMKNVYDNDYFIDICKLIANNSNNNKELM